MNSDIKIISSYHHSFAGGSKNTSRLLHLLSERGLDVNAHFFEIPQYFSYTKSKVKTHTLSAENISSEVIETDNLKNYYITNQIIESIDNTKKNILFSANLFPYGNILHDVKSQLQHLKHNEPKLILHPVGSDIWQVGTQMKSRVKWLLDSPLVDSILTYSDCFVTDIKDYFNIGKEINVLPPVFEKEKFFPISEEEKSQRRRSLGWGDNNFIIHHHSSMRKVKCPEIVLEIAMKSAQLISENCILIMTGPIPYEAIQSLNLNLEKISENKILKYKSSKENLTIYWTDVLSNVEYLIQASDVELNASLQDSFNLALMEAMGCGIPVVTSEVVGIRKHIIKSDGGFCFPTKKLQFDELNQLLKSGNHKNHLFDIDYAVSAILGIANNKTSSLKKGLAGAEYVASEFSFENVSKEFYKHIN